MLILAPAVTVDEIAPTLKTAALGDLKHQVERGTIPYFNRCECLLALEVHQCDSDRSGATIDFTSGTDGKQKAQQLIFRFLIELPEPLIPAEAAQQLVSAQGS